MIQTSLILWLQAVTTFFDILWMKRINTLKQFAVPLLVVIGLHGIGHGALITYDGSSTPDSATYGPIFSTVVFSGTSWSSNGDILTMSTANIRGIWFGRRTDGVDPANFNLGNGLAGNSMEARMRLGSPTSTQWETYFTDLSGHFALIYLIQGAVQFHTASPIDSSTVTTTIPLDTNSYHVYGAHVHNGSVVYSIDGTQVLSGLARTSGSPGILVMGDGSGSTPTGTGSFQLDYWNINTAAGPITLVPEPSSALLTASFALGGVFLRRRRAQ